MVAAVAAEGTAAGPVCLMQSEQRLEEARSLGKQPGAGHPMPLVEFRVPGRGSCREFLPTGAEAPRLFSWRRATV